MSAKVLGRITTPDRPRGPDVELGISVPAAWLDEGATLEVELPRNLGCATCKGGGCDACDRSGAVSLRGRKDPVELVEVTLPRPSNDPANEPRRPFAMRIPDYGGLAPQGSDLPRGHLLLSVTMSDEPSRGVTKLTESRKLAIAERLSSLRPPAPGRRGRVLVAIVAVVVLAMLIALLSRR